MPRSKPESPFSSMDKLQECVQSYQEKAAKFEELIEIANKVGAASFIDSVNNTILAGLTTREEIKKREYGSVSSIDALQEIYQEFCAESFFKSVEHINDIQSQYAEMIFDSNSPLKRHTGAEEFKNQADAVLSCITNQPHLKASLELGQHNSDDFFGAKRKEDYDIPVYQPSGQTYQDEDGEDITFKEMMPQFAEQSKLFMHGLNRVFEDLEGVNQPAGLPERLQELAAYTLAGGSR
jgi:hypothetical protein